LLRKIDTPLLAAGSFIKTKKHSKKGSDALPFFISSYTYDAYL